MTVREMIEWLKTQDQDAEVEVLMKESGCGWDSGDYVTTVTFDASNRDLWDYTDFRGNPHVKPDEPYYGKRYLKLGDS